MYSGKPAASIVVTELVEQRGLGKPEGKRRLNEAGQQAVEATAGKVAELVDGLLHKNWNRTAGAEEETTVPEEQEPVQATCSCGSGIPVQEVEINGQLVTLIALPVIFQHFKEEGKTATLDMASELLNAVKIYNPVSLDEEKTYAETLLREFALFYENEGTTK